MPVAEDEIKGIDDWLARIRSAEHVAEEAYTSLRNSWPGTKPKWLCRPWDRVPRELRALLIEVAERAGTFRKE